jgi:hypothetical protein
VLGVGHDTQLLFFFILFIFLAVLELELRALCLLGRLCTTKATPPALFYDGIFKIGSLEPFAQGWLGAVILLISAS